MPTKPEDPSSSSARTQLARQQISTTQRIISIINRALIMYVSHFSPLTLEEKEKKGKD